MAKFKSPLIVIPMRDLESSDFSMAEREKIIEMAGNTDPDNLWILHEGFDYWTGAKENVIDIPRGFVTDFASIPRILWSTIGGPWGQYGKAAVVHDRVYRNPKMPWKTLTRKEADDILLEAMNVLGVPWYQRWTIYLGVRVGGWVAWNHHRERDLAHPDKPSFRFNPR